MSNRFRSGAEAAEEQAKSRGSFARTDYFSIEDGKSAIVRFLTDGNPGGWITVDVHQNIPTKDKPDDYEGDKWPSAMPAVCRKTKLGDGSTLYPDCYICDEMRDKNGKPYRRVSRTYALACLREEVIEGGKVVGIRDMTKEIVIPEKDGQPEKRETVKAIVVLNQGWRNFFTTLNGYFQDYKTVCDRDYRIRRSGTGTDTTYAIIPLEPIEVDGQRLRGPIYEKQRDGEWTIAQEAHPQWETRYRTDVDLESVIEDQASDDFYARFFDKTKQAPSRKSGDGNSGDAGESQPAKPTNDAVNVDRLQALAGRVRSYGPEEGGTEDATSEPAAASSSGGMRDYG